MKKKKRLKKRPPLWFSTVVNFLADGLLKENFRRLFLEKVSGALFAGIDEPLVKYNFMRWLLVSRKHGAYRLDSAQTRPSIKRVVVLLKKAANGQAVSRDDWSVAEECVMDAKYKIADASKNAARAAGAAAGRTYGVMSSCVEVIESREYHMNVSYRSGDRAAVNTAIDCCRGDVFNAILWLVQVAVEDAKLTVFEEEKDDAAYKAQGIQCQAMATKLLQLLEGT